MVNLNKKINIIYFLKCKKQIYLKGGVIILKSEHTVKVSYNVTQVVFNLYKHENGNVIVDTQEETILHKRDSKYIENYLNKKYKEYLTVELVDYQHKSFKSVIPFTIALEYGLEV